MSGQSHEQSPTNDTDLMVPDFEGKKEDVSKSAKHIADQAYKAGHGKAAGVAQQLMHYHEPLLSEILFHLMQDHGNTFAGSVGRKVKKLQASMQDDPDGLMEPGSAGASQQTDTSHDPDGLMKPGF